jgi:DNA repair exonuclease SbcCD nuclease subunit
MLFSHISDTHLGLAQYNLKEREQDVYDAFNQAIEISIKDHVDFVIFAGDIFDTPKPNGNAILQMANALKRLKENNIDSFFILGEHDISNIKDQNPVPYVYHNLGFSKHIGDGTPIEYKGVMLVGFDKIRPPEMAQNEERFSKVDKNIKKFPGHRILVLHQGVTEFDKMAAEIQSTDLPKNFTYYAMGHLHPTGIKQFNHLNGPIVYPGSIELTSSEKIKDTKKGFFEVDISGKEAIPKWIELDTRPQFPLKAEYKELTKTIDEIIEKIKDCVKKPIIDLKIQGEDIEIDYIQAQIARLNSLTLKCSWGIDTKQISDSSVFLDRPNEIEDEIFKLSIKALDSDQDANFAINELLPKLSKERRDQGLEIIIENYEKFKKEEKQ